MINPKILVIDDDEGMRTQLKWGLEGYDVITANSRSNAIEQFEIHRPPLVTLDLGLPPDAEGISEGFAILREIIKIAPETKVVVVSGAENVGNAERAKTNGAFEYYPKPVDIGRLQLLIERAYADYQSENK